jgi:hypothetical protein
VCQLAQLPVGGLGGLLRFGHERPGVLRVAVERAERELQREDRVHEALLRAIVQVAHHAAPSLVAGREETFA